MTAENWISIASLFVTLFVGLIGAGLLRWMFKINGELAVVKTALKALIKDNDDDKKGKSEDLLRVWERLDGIHKKVNSNSERIAKLEK